MAKANVSRDDLKSHIRELRNELDLSTYINKGAITENKELKARLEELEQENLALRTTETRLTEAEDKLDEQDQVLKEKEALIKRMKETVCNLKSSLRNMTRQRDGWTGRWGRLLNLVQQEEQVLDDSDTEPPTDFPTLATMNEKIVNNPPVRSDAYERASEVAGPSHSSRIPASNASVGSIMHRYEEPNGPSKVASTSHQTSSKKKRRRIGDESSSDDEPYKPYRPSSDVQAPVRPPSARERKRPAIQLGVVKLETPTPEPEPELPPAPSKSSLRRQRARRDDGDESDDEALGQW